MRSIQLERRLAALAFLAALTLLGTAACGRRQAGNATLRSRRTVTRPEPLRVATPPVTNHACELFTKDDAEAVLGGEVEAPITKLVPDIGVVSSRCGYIAKGVKPAKVVTLLAKTWRDPADARHAFEHAHALSQTVSGEAPQNLDGLGDRAYWEGGTISQLHVLAGNVWMIFGGTTGPGIDPRPQDQAAAHKALSHLRS